MAASDGRLVSSSMLAWLDALEKDFDKAFVGLDLLLGEIDSDQADIMFESRQKMTSLSGAFAQLVHKAQTIFQRNVRQEVCSLLYSAELSQQDKLSFAHSQLQ
ncbi:unnamed protein product [Gongylonema pulchrum]|uniref:Conserved oligomeric Golgi complex subunit 7 n=1 Tax=Gongylonema pulchrum TaxID=637853 RepID=A0A183EG86_9BILA|nr:unnamed protein product [Gongylonema pulchrum]